MLINDGRLPSGTILAEVIAPDETTISSDLSASPNPTFSLTGVTTNAVNGYPLANLRVTAYFIEPTAQTNAAESTSSHPVETLLGEAVSDANGRFEISFLNTLIVRQRLCLLTQFSEPFLLLKVENAANQVYHISKPISGAGRSVNLTLPVTLPKVKVTQKLWRTLADRLEEAHTTQIHQVVQALAGLNNRQSLFADWNLETRQAVLTKLEQAFLDPNDVLNRVGSPVPTFSELQTPGVLEAFQDRLKPNLENPRVKFAFDDFVSRTESFDSLVEVDWRMDLKPLREGDVGSAMNQFIDRDRGDSNIGDPILIDQMIAALTDEKLIGYRDYLRAVWTDWVTLAFWINPSPTPEEALEQLEHRLHQDFRTRNTFSQSANQILIPILRQILTARTGSGWGFGISADEIRSQQTTGESTKESSREYLDYLISLTKLSAHELGLRYRLDFERPDSALSSPVQENISTLQRFFCDSFQSGPEPFHVEPDEYSEKQPIIHSKIQGKAPFFLHYEEWLRHQAPFYGENFLDVRQTLTLSLTEQGLKELKKWASVGGSSKAHKEKTKAQDEQDFILAVAAMYNALIEGHTHYYRNEYKLALDAYLRAKELASSSFYDLKNEKLGQEKRSMIETRLAERKKLPVNNMDDLHKFIDPFDYRIPWEINAPYEDKGFERGGVKDLEDFQRDRQLDNFIMKLAYYTLYVLPACLSDVYLAQGEYERALFHCGQVTRFAVGIAKETSQEGYRAHLSKDNADELYYIGDRPYTVNLSKDPYPIDADTGELYDTNTRSFNEQMAEDWMAKYIHPVERRYFCLRQGNAMLEWADTLYRSNDASNIARARELYKGVLWLHREAPPIRPNWSNRAAVGRSSSTNRQENPAIASQKARAREGFYKIEAGLNYYGEQDNFVPALRYRPLKEAADRFAALAKAAQQDFLLYTEKMENALIERMKLSNLMQKAALQTEVAQEQTKIAEYNVKIAQEQVANIEAQIAAKIKEIEDHNGFFSQLSDFVGGVAKTFTSLPASGQSTIKDGFAAGVAGKEIASEGLLGLGTGGAMMAGFGTFVVAGYLALDSMNEASSKRAGELSTLRDKALPAAKAMVNVKKREVTIAGYQRQIAQADIDLAKDLIHFEENRFLNQNFWANLSQIVKRIMRRYLELGARTAWLAERALAYEQDRLINIVRLDYFPAKLQGVTGANLLEADLAELEATYIEGIKRTVPVKHTISLARNYPLQFGQLKKTGRCTFKTEEASFQTSYPGTKGYRIRATSVTVNQTSLINPLRGLLINQGISISNPGQPAEHTLVRPAEALPISEFRLQNDMGVYGLPNETLLTFEGSTIETFWELHFPTAANADGLEGLVDVLITFDLRAEYSPDLYTKQLSKLPKSVQRWILVSAQQHQPKAIADLAGEANSVTIDFDLNAIGLPNLEINRKVKNLAIFFASSAPIDATALFNSTGPSTSININLTQGVAMSNVLPDSTANDALPPQPLNAMVDISASQRFSLVIDKGQNSGIDFSQVKDVVLSVEYSADLG